MQYVPLIGHLTVTELKTRHFTALLKGIEEKGLLEVAPRTRLGKRLITDAIPAASKCENS